MERLVNGSALKIDILQKEDSKEHNLQEDSASVMRNALKFNAQQYTSPLLRKTLTHVKQSKQLPIDPQRWNQSPQLTPEQEPIIDLNDPSFELDGSRLNMKTRRQRVLESISFETDCHNIYEPYFTSEDELAQSDHSVINSEQVDQMVAQGFTTKRRQAIQRECSSEELNSSDELSSESSISQYLSKASHECVNLAEIRLEIPQFEEERIIRACELDGQSLSSIEVESFEEDEEEDRPRSALLENRVRQMPNEQQVSPSPLIERKQTPPENDQRQTFGCLTPMGMTLGKPQQINGPFHFIDEGSQMPIRISTHKFNQDQLAGLAQFAEDFKGEYTQDSLPDSVEAICEGDQSPIGKNLIVPTDLSPVLPEYTIMQRKRTQLVPRRLDNRSEEREGLYPQLVAQQNLFLQNGEITHRDMITSEDNSSISQIPKSQKRFIGEKESCFSPIQIEINDQSLSREGVIAAAQAQEAIQNLQGPCFSSVDYDDVTMVQYNLPASSDQQQSVNGLFGHREIAMTSNFAQNNEPQYIVEDLTASDIAVRNMIGNSSLEQNVHDGALGSNTINLSNHYNQSFSAFHTKHVMHAHQTPLNLQNKRDLQQHHLGECRNYEEEPPIADSACKHKKKKFYIKQEQLTQLLQKAMEKKVTKKSAHVTGNLFGDNTISSSEALMFIRQEGPSLLDSLIQQNYVKFEDDSGRSREFDQQQGIKTSQKKKSANQVLPKHQKSIKTQDFGGAYKREGSIEDLRNGMHFSEDRAARVQENTKSLKQLQFNGSVSNISNSKKLRVLKHQAEPQSRQLATQPIKDQKANNQHSSFNNILLKNRINGHANDSERMIPTEVEEGPQTMRERQGYPELCADLQANGKYSVKVTDTRKIAVTPQFLINAFRNHIPPESQHALTKEQLNELLRSAICSSRYSTSSNGMNVAAALPSLNQAPSNYHNSTQQLEHNGLMRQLSIDQHKGSLHKANNSSGKKHANEYEMKLAGKPSLSPNRGARKNMPLLTEGCEISTQRYNNEYLHHHHHQRSIDQSSIQNHSSNKLGERKDSFTRKWQPPSAQNQMKFAKQLMAAQQTNSSVEKQRRKGLVNYASLDKQRSKAKKKTDQGSKDRLKQKKKPYDGPKPTVPQKMFNQLLQNQTNLSGIGSGFNTNNASNFVTKNIFANQSSAQNNHTTIQDNSNNLILNTMLATSGQQCEMSTTISNNQLSLTRIQNITNNNRGQSTGALNTQFLTKFVNQTVSSGSNQPSVINSTSLLGTKAKVLVPQLQLSKIKPAPQLNSRRGKQLNGSQDEIQLQSLLQNLNQHLQTNQTRASIHQDTSSSILRTPINVVMPQSNRVMGMQGNTKRSQVSSMSAQRQSVQLGKGRRKDSSEQPPPEFIQVRTAQLNKTMNRPSIKKAGGDYKTSIPPSTSTAQQKDRKFKSKDPLQFVGAQRQSIGKKGLQNSFTMKNLKQMIGALALPVGGAALQNQLTTRLQESEPAEMREFVKSTADSCERLIEGLQQDPTKMRLQGQNKKVLLNITQSSGGNGMAEVNRSSLISQKGQQSGKAAHLSKTATQNIIRRQQQVPSVKQTRFTNAPVKDDSQGNGIKNTPSASDLNRLFDTQKDLQASPTNRLLKFSKAPMPERYTLQPNIPPAKQHTMTLKSIFTKQQPINASHYTNQSTGMSHQVFNTFQA